MELSSSTFIAGHQTVRDWKKLRSELITTGSNDLKLWMAAYEDYFIARQKMRYLQPIDLIRKEGSYSGEGFSIVTILCSIIEFLETTYQGINYRHVKKNDLPIGNYEYSRSGEIFKTFLTTKIPLKNAFNLELSESFYTNVRCALLHEAKTSGTWTIWAKSDDDRIVSLTDCGNILFRDNFYDAILDYVNNWYPKELFASQDRKDAFIRKFDHLCLA